MSVNFGVVGDADNWKTGLKPSAHKGSHDSLSVETQAACPATALLSCNSCSLEVSASGYIQPHFFSSAFTSVTAHLSGVSKDRTATSGHHALLPLTHAAGERRWR